MINCENFVALDLSQVSIGVVVDIFVHGKKNNSTMVKNKLEEEKFSNMIGTIFYLSNVGRK